MELITNDREFLGAVIGTLLGDASLALVSGLAKNSRLVFGQSVREYALWKKQALEWGCPFGEYEDIKGMTRVYSNRLPLFTALRERMYYSGRKTVDAHVLKVLTPLGLAMWYYDDGDFHKTHLRVLISTMSFNYAEHELIQEKVYEKFGLHFNVHTRKTHSGLKVFYLRLKNADRELFFDTIAPYKIDCMAYKFPTAEGADKIRNNTRLNTEDLSTKMPTLEMVSLYEQGNSIYKLSKHFNVNSGTILGRLRKAGVEIRNAGHYSS